MDKAKFITMEEANQWWDEMSYEEQSMKSTERFGIYPDAVSEEQKKELYDFYG